MLHDAQTHHHISTRESSLDFLRGIAVILMTAAHVIFFVHTDTSGVLRMVARSANTVVFTLFLFVSGAATLVSLRGTSGFPDKEETKRILKHSCILLAGFYIVAFFILLTNPDHLPVVDIVKHAGEILTLTRVPGFSEFLLPFAFFSFSTLLLKPFYSLISRSFILTLLFSFVLYGSGMIFYRIADPTSPIKELLALFVGAEGTLRFPIIQYSPVFLIGLWWGRFLEDHPEKKDRDRMALRIGSSTFILLTLFTALSVFYPLGVLDPLYRWPPSVGFLSVGITVAFFLVLWHDNFHQPKILSYIRRIVKYLGRDSFDLYVSHILLLHVYRRVFGTQFQDPFIVGLLLLAFLYLSVFLSSLNWRLSPSIFMIRSLTGVTETGTDAKKRYLLIAGTLLAFTFVPINMDARFSTIGGILPKANLLGSAHPPLPQQEQTEVISDSSVPWFNSDYGHYQQITVTNNDVLPIRAGEILDLQIDHKQLMTNKQSKQDGSDLHIAYFTANGFHSIRQTVFLPSDEATTILFEIKETIYPGTGDNRYFLYYDSDNPLPREQPPSQSISPMKRTVMRGEESAHPVLVTINKHWFVPEYFPEQFLEATLIHGGISTNATEQTIRYRVDNTNISGAFSNTSSSTTVSINPGELTPGTYTLSTYSSDSSMPQGPKRKFSVSAPVFVTWSLDWEGWDVPIDTLDRIDSIANSFALPVTHYFNPRIFLPGISTDEQIRVLRSWIIDRSITRGDEIALHLHMHFDAVNAAGVPPRTEPKWGYRSTEGYDVFTSAYTLDELKRIFTWAKQTFVDNGLPDPVAYRAGGWYANDVVLRALSETGFVYDSSGRTQPETGAFVKIPWRLRVYSQPYYPSAADQNGTGFDALSILEIPNNGGNTFEFTASELTRNFTQNYNGGPATKRTVVTFLSHPQWHTAEFPKIESVLTHVSDYLYDQDNGPVIFVTSDTISKIWGK